MFDKYFFGSLIIYIGFGLLLATTQVPGFEYVEPYWWSLGFVLLGVIVLARSKKAVFPGIVLIAIGLIMMANKLDFINVGVWDLFWPVFLICIGFWIIFRKKKLFGKEKVVNSNFPNFVNIFSGSKHMVESADFKGAEVEVMFGGTEIDLRDASVPSGKAILDITVNFGGVTLFVPRNWRIVADGTPIFGALENKSRQDKLDVDSPQLTIRYFVMFGGIDIKN